MAIFEVTDALGRGANMADTSISYLPGNSVVQYGAPIVSQYDIDTFNIVQAYVYNDGSFAFFGSLYYREFSSTQFIIESVYYYDINRNPTISMYGVDILANINSDYSSGAILTNFLSGNDSVYGNNFDDYLKSGGGNDEVFGRGGDDIIQGGLGNDYIDGGLGDDALDYSASNAAVTVNLSTGFSSGGDGQDQFVSIEGVLASQLSDVIIGNNGDNFFIGLGGADTIDGSSGSDTLVYTDNNKSVVITLNGAISTNVIINGIVEDNIKNIENVIAGFGNDTIIGDGQVNTFFGEAGNDTFTGNGGNDFIYGELGIDKAIYSNSYAQAQVTRNTDKSRTITTSLDGSDTVSGVEQFRFSDGLYSFTFTNPGPAVIANFNVAKGWSSQDQFPRHIADMNGDGYADIVGFGFAGVFVAYGSAAASFVDATLVLSNFGQTAGWTSDNRFHREVVDVNGDGRADIVGFGQAGTLVSLARSDGSFADPILGVANFGVSQGWTTQDGYARTLGDVNGDGFVDIVGFGAAGTLVSLGNGNGTFQPAKTGIANFGVSQGWSSDNSFHRAVADVTGDGKDDLIGFGIGGTFVAVSRGDGTFDPAQLVLNNFGASQGWSSDDKFPRLVADVNGDAIADIVGFGIAGTLISFGLGNGTFSDASFDLANFGGNQGWSSDNDYHRAVADMNNDGLADVVGFGVAGVLVGLNDGTIIL